MPLIQFIHRFNACKAIEEFKAGDDGAPAAAIEAGIKTLIAIKRKKKQPHGRKPRTS